MTCIVLIVYVIVALVIHFIIYRDNSDSEVEPSAANIASILWPFTLLIMLIVFVENKFKKLLN